jgi:uroporphyrinogen III methyltransferase/synthase
MLTPLSGKKIIITRAGSQSDNFLQNLESLGAEVINFPTIEIKPIENQDIEPTLKRIDTYDWIIFTSVNGVKLFFTKFFQKKIALKQLENTKFAVIGPKTADALSNYGFTTSLLPAKFVTGDLINEFSEMALKGKKILLPVAELAGNILPEKLVEFGAIVDNVTIYQTVMPSSEKTDIVAEKLKNKEIDYITFTSSSTVTNFFELLKNKNIQKLLKNVKIVTIGPVTAKTVTDTFGISPLIADSHTIDGIITAIISDIKVET